MKHFLSERYAPALYCWILGQVRDTDVADDILADTFVEALRGLHRCRADGPTGAGGWLFGIARNLIRKRARRHAQDARAQGRLVLLNARDAPGDDEASVRADELREALGAALESLPDGQRRAVLLRVAQGETYATIGETLRCSVGAARVRVSRGLRALASSMNEVGQ